MYGPLEPELKPEPLKKRYQEMEPLGKKSGARAAWEKIRSRSRLKKGQEPELLKN